MTLWNLFWGFGVFIATWETAKKKKSVPEKAHVGVACVSGRGWGGGAEWAVGGGARPLSENKLAYESSENVDFFRKKMSSVRTKLSSGKQAVICIWIRWLGFAFSPSFPLGGWWALWSFSIEEAMWSSTEQIAYPKAWL